jgi:molecular chaperone GrpE
MSESRGGKHEEVPDRVIIRDKRRIDPATGQQREPDPDPAMGPTFGSGPAGSAGAPVDPADSAGPADADSGPNIGVEEIMALEATVAERTADLQRLQAEYANYRKRVERDRVTMRDLAVADVLVSLLPVVDDVDRARTHGDLSGAFKAVADQLDVTLTKLGLEPFGDVGDQFDPALHEAVMHSEAEDVTEPTVTLVMRKGYKFADRLVRPAMVGVSEPAHLPASDEPAESTE